LLTFTHPSSNGPLLAELNNELQPFPWFDGEMESLPPDSEPIAPSQLCALVHHPSRRPSLQLLLLLSPILSLPSSFRTLHLSCIVNGASSASCFVTVSCCAPRAFRMVGSSWNSLSVILLMAATTALISNFGCNTTCLVTSHLLWTLQIHT
jgi:hypothetical protein